MKVVHIESGLGNQMLSFCEYLALKNLHPNEDIYIETIVYDIPECNEVIKQWNGYELERIFGIKAPNIRQVFNDEQWTRIMNFLIQSKFWDKNWNYPVYITQALRNEGIEIRNIRGDFEQRNAGRNINMRKKHSPSFKERIVDTSVGEWLKRNYRSLRKGHFISHKNWHNSIFYKETDNIFTGQWLGLKHIGSGMEQLEEEVRNVFKFPPFEDKRNREMSQRLETYNTVAIHARRGDMLGSNGYCYKFGYFQRAVKHIKKCVENPIFVFFCDPGSTAWCKENGKIFGLDYNRDEVWFVDWNKGEQSFRDMQIMSHCKHAIITNSSFGWWGSFFISNPHKITISPKQEITVNTTYHC